MVEPTWFERDEHKAIQACTCVCGHHFDSEARSLPCVTTKNVMDPDGKVILENGVPKTEPVGVMRRISKLACPECSSNWISSFDT